MVKTPVAPRNPFVYGRILSVNDAACPRRRQLRAPVAGCLSGSFLARSFVHDVQWKKLIVGVLIEPGTDEIVEPKPCAARERQGVDHELRDRPL
jgi:hypothetical protein